MNWKTIVPTAAAVGKSARTEPRVTVKRGDTMESVPNPAAAPGVTLTAMDMGRAMFQSDVWPPKRRAMLTGAMDVCSYITRVLFGRNLMMGRGPIRVDLENGHHLLITMRANNDVINDTIKGGLTKEQARALRWAVNRAAANECVLGASQDPAYKNRVKRAQQTLEELTS